MDINPTTTVQVANEAKAPGIRLMAALPIGFDSKTNKDVIASGM
jgi:hypothetical protein